MKNTVKAKNTNTKKKQLSPKPDRTVFFLLLLVLISAFIAFAPTLNNDFINNWDDNVYILKNDLIKHFDWQHIKQMFASFYGGNYHPLTALSNALEYHFFKLNPLPYHLINLLLHLANVVLVFMFVRKLSGKDFIALFTAAFFAVHPLRVESVAWLAERKDVLYSFFFLISLILYLQYRDNKTIKLYLATIISFLLSLLSKSAAVVLPVVLVLIDLYKDKKITLKQLIPKIPFFVLSFIFGIVALYSQKSSEAFTDFASQYSILERIFLICYSTVFYIFSAFLPVHLSALHYYPFNTNGLPIVYYLALPALLFLLIPFFRKHNLIKEYRFSLLFYLATIFLVLQIIPVGQAVVAERYSYIPHIGVFFFVAIGLDSLFIKNVRYKKTLLPLLFVAFAISGWMTYERTKVWKNGYTLFSDVIEKYPEQGHAYWVRGNYHNETQNYKAALNDFDRAVALQCKEPGLYMSRGFAYHFLGNYKQAIADYNISMQLRPNFAGIYYNRGTTYMLFPDSLDKALQDFNKAIELDPNYDEAIFNRANVKDKMGDTQGAIDDYTRGLQINPYDPMAYFNRGICYNKLKEFQKAINDFNTALKTVPDNAEILLNRAISKDGLKDYQGALEDNNRVLQLKPGHPHALFNRGIAKFYLNDRNGACADWKEALANGNPQAQIILQEYCSQ